MIIQESVKLAQILNERVKSVLTITTELNEARPNCTIKMGLHELETLGE